MEIEKQRLRFLQGLAEKLGHYVYALRDPRDGIVFYIGKGIGDRAYAHVTEARLPNISPLDAKSARIKAVHAANREVIVEIVHRRLPDEHVAYLVECAVIDAITHCGRAAELSNLVAGRGSKDTGWASVEQLAHLAAKRVGIPASMRPALLIRPKSKFRPNMDELQLREITRKNWKVARRDYRYIFCVYEGIVRGVWRVLDEDPDPEIAAQGRRGFIVEPADEVIWQRFHGGSVAHLLPRKGGQNPVRVLV